MARVFVTTNIFDMKWGPLRAAVLRRCETAGIPRQDWEDVAQNAALKLHESCIAVGQRASVARIARFTVLQWLDRTTSTTFTDSNIDGGDVEDDTRPDDIPELIARALRGSGLTYLQRTAVMLHYGVDGCQPHTQEQIATMMGCTQKVVCQRLQRALGKMKASLAGPVENTSGDKPATTRHSTAGHGRSARGAKPRTPARCADRTEVALG